MTKAEADRLIQETGGDPRKLEQALGLPEGTLDGDSLVRVDFEGDRVKMPDGNEFGANSQWEPGGKTSGGVDEAVIDGIPPGSKAPNDGFTVSDI